MSASPALVQCITNLRYACWFGNTGKPHFFGIQFQTQYVQLRASDFAPPHFGTPLFPSEFAGCSSPVLSASKTLGIPGVFAFLANCFGFPARPFRETPLAFTRLGWNHPAYQVPPKKAGPYGQQVPRSHPDARFQRPQQPVPANSLLLAPCQCSSGLRLFCQRCSPQEFSCNRQNDAFAQTRKQVAK